MSHFSRVLPVAVTVALGALALPASALAASNSGVVLTTNAPRNVVQVVDAKHAVHAYRNKQAGKLRLGSRVRFDVSHGRMTNVAVGKRAPEVTFAAKVATTGNHGLVLDLGDHHTLKLNSKRLKHAMVLTTKGTKSSLKAVKTGANLRVTEPVQGGALRLVVTAKLVPVKKAPVTPVPTFQSAQGEVTAVPTATGFHITADDGTPYDFVVDAETQAPDGAAQWCDDVTVEYQVVGGGELLVHKVWVDSVSTDGECALVGATADGAGTITAITADRLTVSSKSGGPSETLGLQQDPAAVSGFAVGDDVSYSYELTQNQTDQLTSIAYRVESSGYATITATTANSLTTAQSTSGSGAGTVATGPMTTYGADASVVAGVRVGDEVRFSYEVRAGAPTILDDGSFVDSGPAGG